MAEFQQRPPSRESVPSEPPGTNHPGSAWRLRVFRIISLSISTIAFLAAAFVVGEVVVRLFLPVSDPAYLFWDPVVGPRRLPNQSGFTIGKEMHGAFHFNAQGWNHPKDYVIRKAVGTRRVCLVGDSFVEALHVAPEETHFMIAEHLMKRSDRPVQWYAFGCSGMGTAQEYLIIRNYVLDYQPDVVIILFVDNDPYDCSPYLLPPGSTSATYTLDKSEDLELIPSFPWNPSPWKRIAKRSAVARYLFVQKNLLRRQSRTELAREALVQPNYHALRGGVMTMEERGRKTWVLIEALLRAARDDCARRGAAFLLAYSGSRKHMHVAYLGETYSPPPIAEDPYCLIPEKRQSELGSAILEPMAKRLNVPYLDLTGAMIEEMARTGRRYDFPQDEHYGPVGHAAAGKALAAWVEAVWAKRADDPLRPQ